MTKKFTYIIYYKKDYNGFYMFDAGAGYSQRSYTKTNFKTLESLKIYLKKSLKGFNVRFLKGK